ncbi:MAG: copper resistance protein CopC [Dehalococcoidia bacterium]
MTRLMHARGARARLAALVAAVVVAVALTPGLAEAHAQVARSEPAAGAKGAAPQMVKVWFTEPVDRSASTLTVVDAKGAQVDRGDKAQPADDQTLLTVSLKPGLPDGVYTVKWSALTSDNATTSGEFQFGIGAGSSPAAAPPNTVSTGGIAATIRIGAPADGAVVTGADVPLTLHLNAITLVEEGESTAPAGSLPGHLHVWVDDTVIGMPSTLDGLVIRGLATGKHTIRVELAAPNHFPYAPTIDARTTVEVKGGATGGSVTLAAAGQTVGASSGHDHAAAGHTADAHASHGTADAAESAAPAGSGFPGGRVGVIALVAVIAAAGIAIGARMFARR